MGKKIAIVGYEVDQVFTNDAGIDSKCSYYWAYNHHYEAYLRNGDNSFSKINENKYDPNDLGQYNHGARKDF